MYLAAKRAKRSTGTSESMPAMAAAANSKSSMADRVIAVLDSGYAAHRGYVPNGVQLTLNCFRIQQTGFDQQVI